MPDSLHYGTFSPASTMENPNVEVVRFAEKKSDC